MPSGFFVMAVVMAFVITIVIAIVMAAVADGPVKPASQSIRIARGGPIKRKASLFRGSDLFNFQPFNGKQICTPLFWFVCHLDFVFLLVIEVDFED